jgi:hypothetical protein
MESNGLFSSNVYKIGFEKDILIVFSKLGSTCLCEKMTRHGFVILSFTFSRVILIKWDAL